MNLLSSLRACTAPAHRLRRTLAAAGFALAAGCVLSQDHRVGTFDFGYAATGDARVLPVQVFDDGLHTYVQVRQGEALPAIFADDGATLRLLLPQPHGPFWRVPERHGRLVLQSGRAGATVVHLGSERAGAPAWIAESASGHRLADGSGHGVARLVAPVSKASEPDDALERNSYAQPLRGDRAAWTGSALAPARSLSAGAAPAVAARGAAGVSVSSAEPASMRVAAPIATAGSPARAAPAPAAGAPTVSAAPPPDDFQVKITDPHLRQVLVRWAQAAGWTHGPDHWAIDRDLPVVAAAGPEIFGADFREAVRRLLATSELTDRPVQPCFYSNRVLRVIARGDACARGGDAG